MGPSHFQPGSSFQRSKKALAPLRINPSLFLIWNLFRSSFFVKPETEGSQLATSIQLITPSLSNFLYNEISLLHNGQAPSKYTSVLLLSLMSTNSLSLIPANKFKNIPRRRSFRYTNKSPRIESTPVI